MGARVCRARGALPLLVLAVLRVLGRSELADYGVAHTTLGRFFGRRPEAVKELKRAD